MMSGVNTMPILYKNLMITGFGLLTRDRGIIDQLALCKVTPKKTYCRESLDKVSKKVNKNQMYFEPDLSQKYTITL